MPTPSFAGTFPMLYAFFDEDGALRPGVFARQVAAAAACGAQGVAVLGLGTEGARLSAAERRACLAEVIEAAGGRLPVAVTIPHGERAEMVALARAAQAAGAAWLILQPPPPRCAEDDLIAHFADLAAALEGPVAIQNAPEFLGLGLSTEGILRLADRAPWVQAVKAECSALDAGGLVDRLGGRLAVLNGRAGLELTDNARAGVQGMIPGIETADLQAASLAAMRAGREAEAEALYARALPTIVFIMQGIAHFVRYGRLIAALRLGIDPGRPRLPAKGPSARGLAWATRLAGDLGPLPT